MRQEQLQQTSSLSGKMQISIANIIRGTLIGNTMSVLTRYISRVVNGGGIVESPQCVETALNSQGLLQQASLLVVPSGYKGGTLYSEIPTNGNGDLTWTRTSTANRTNSSGLLESMGSGVPRLSYMYGSCPSVLLEPQRTNLALWSEDITSAVWLKARLNTTANTTTSPDGTTNADTIAANGSNSDHTLYNLYTTTEGTAYTFSCYLKANTGRYVLLRIMTTGATFRYGITFDLQTGTITQTSTTATAPSGTSNTITNVGNGWYRISLTLTASGTQSGVIVATSNSATPTLNANLDYVYTGSESYYLYGMQLEAGAYPTTYIPTTTATATRVADSFSRNNIYTNGLITSSGGTWFVELRGNVAYLRDSANECLGIGDSSNTNSLLIRNGGGTNRLSVQKRIAGVITILFTTTTDTTKIAIKWNGTSADIFVNGTKQVSATAFTTTIMEFLRGSGDQVPTFIQQMALFPTPLSDTDCTTLTTL